MGAQWEWDAVEVFVSSSLDDGTLGTVFSIIYGVSVHILPPPFTPQRFVDGAQNSAQLGFHCDTLP